MNRAHDTVYTALRRCVGFSTKAAAAALFLCVAWAAPAQAQFSASAVPFLRIEPDSRFAAMGNSGVALADNVNAVYWNPAGLAYQRGAELALTHANWLPEFPDANLFYEYLTGKYHVDGVGTFGGHVTYFNLGEHERRISASDQNPDTFRSYEFAIGGSYGVNLSETFAIGTGARFIYSKLTDATAEGASVDPGTSFGIDLGALYRTRPFSLGSTETTFSAGFNLANFGPSITYISEENAIPTNLRAGYAFTFDFDEYNSLTFTNDFNKLLTRSDTTAMGETVVDGPFKALFSSWGSATVTQQVNDANEIGALEQITVGTGLEYWYNQLFALRTGYFYEHPDNGNRQLLTFGAGLRYNIVGVDFSYIYALEEDSPLSGQLRFSLLIDFTQQ